MDRVTYNTFDEHDVEFRKAALAAAAVSLSGSDKNTTDLINRADAAYRWLKGCEW